jgi:hypothetical protein
LTEWELLVAEVTRLREENKLLLAYNLKLIDEQTELEDKLDDNIKVIDRLSRENDLLKKIVVISPDGRKTVIIINDPLAEIDTCNILIKHLQEQNVTLHNQMRQMREDYEKRLRGLV